MTEDEIFAWFKKNKKLLATFDVDDDGAFSYHEIRWAVKTTINWADYARENPNVPCWQFAQQKKVLGPVTWEELSDKIVDKRVLFVKKEGERNWLPFRLIDKIRRDGVDTKDTEKSISDYGEYSNERESAHKESVREDNGWVEPSKPQYLKDEVIPELWSDSIYFVQRSTFLESSHSGRIFSSQGAVAKIRVDTESIPLLARVSNYRNRGFRDALSTKRTMHTNRVIIETMEGYPLYAISRKTFSLGFYCNYTLYDMMNQELGIVSIGKILVKNFIFYSSMRVQLDEGRISPIIVSGPFFEQHINVRNQKVGSIQMTSASDIEHIAGRSRLNRIEITRNDDFLAQAIVFALICRVERFWQIREYPRTASF